MSTMVAELYDALLSAGSDEAKARAAAKAVAENESRFDALERKQIEHDGKFTLLQWMLGFNLALTMAIFWKLFG
jgi:hypothetical protein